MPKKNNKEYKAQVIRVLEGLEAVRKRPAMYIGSTGPKGLHHLVYEAVDNSIDEALAGYCDKIIITLDRDGFCSVEDNGRGIPTDIHPTEGVSAVQVVLTKLHAGGKFEKDAYKFSGGLHGVGISVVNALSQWLEVTVYRDEKIYYQKYERGKPLALVKAIGDTTKNGTTIKFLPDSKIFQETTEFSFETLSARLRELAFLNKNVRITINDERTNKHNEFFFEGGIVSFVQHINKKKIPLFSEVIYSDQSNDKYILELAMQYNDGYGEQLLSFVNNINTIEGGTHVSGFKSALTKICNKKAQDLNILKGESFSSEDVREGLVCVLSIKVPEPQFEGQTKTKLGNSEIKGVVDSWIFAFLDTFFEENPSIIKKILQKAYVAKRAREAAKKARELTRRKTVLESMILPGKLSDCTNEDPGQSELFIVEGDSAGGTARGGRDRTNQAILPLKGKILNVEKARLDKILSNDEIKALIAAIGCGVGQEDFEVNKARYHKIILMTDADVDGSHIRTLLLTFFFRYMRPVIEKGYLYISRPPLYKAKIGRKEQYLKDDNEFQQFLFDWAREQTTLIIDNKELDTVIWHQLLKDVQRYDEDRTRISANFSISYDHCHALVTTLAKDPWKESDGITRLLEIIKKRFTTYSVRIQEPALENEEIEQSETEQQTYIIFQKLSKKWKIPFSFFISPEIIILLNQLEKLALLENKEWRLKIVGKERHIIGTTVLQLIAAISAISKPYMNIQRYKGLGEMNADQLWETSMNSKTRQLLKVTIEDALEADRWFTTLMGDDVKGRKEYIEKYGQFVKNLDV